MGKKGGARHVKRLAAPGFWPIHRKEKVWITKPTAGPHSLTTSLPLILIIRDILGVAKTRKEVKSILADGKIKVDGKIRCDEKFPIGLMDVIDISDMKRAYRILPSGHRKLQLNTISNEEKTFKLCRIENKSTMKNGDIQLNLHDGKNIKIKVADPTKQSEDVYKTLDVLKINLADNQILEHLKFEEGSYAIIFGGKNIGKYGKIVAIEKASKASKPIVTIECSDGNRYNSVADYVFIIGKDKPLISLPEAK